jgi:hypothetical protein
MWHDNIKTAHRIIQNGSRIKCGLCADGDKLQVPNAAGSLSRAAGNQYNMRERVVGTEHLYYFNQLTKSVKINMQNSSNKPKIR